MDGSLETLINLYQFPTGRRLFAHKQIRARAEADGFDKLVKHCDKAISHDTQTQSLEKRWAGESNTSDANPDAQRLDILVDRTLGAIRDHAIAQAAGAPDNDPIHATVDTFIKTVFPGGVHAITSLPYVEELEAVQAIVHSLQNELAPTITELNLQRHTARLAALAIDYRKALEAPAPSLIHFGNVRAARAEGQGLLLETVAIILGKHHNRSAKSSAERLNFLEPILRQNEALGAAFKNRRAPSDINADTGEELSNAPAAPTHPSSP
jgi:hypothetical protein